MIRDTRSDCPHVEAISLLADGEIHADERRDIEAHVAACPLCGAALRDFQRLRTQLHALGNASAGVDVAALIADRLPPRVGPQARARAEPRRPRWRWQFAPAGFAAAGVLAAGAYLGVLLTGAPAAAVVRPAAVAVFDAVPPGGLCLGASCYDRGK